MMEDLRPDETELTGAWINVDGEVDGDVVCERIQFLTNERLETIGKDPSGWDTLFQDPQDGRYWERIYPQGDWHGGGPPMLTNLSANEAREKYSHLFRS